MATLVNRILATRTQGFLVSTPASSSTSALPSEQTRQARGLAVADTGGQPPAVRSEADHTHLLKLEKSANLYTHQLNKQLLLSATISMVCYAALSTAEDS